MYFSPQAGKQGDIKGLVTVWHTSPHKLASIYSDNSSIDGRCVSRMTLHHRLPAGAKMWRYCRLSLLCFRGQKNQQSSSNLRGQQTFTQVPLVWVTFPLAKVIFWHIFNSDGITHIYVCFTINAWSDEGLTRSNMWTALWRFTFNWDFIKHVLLFTKWTKQSLTKRKTSVLKLNLILKLKRNQVWIWIEHQYSDMDVDNKSLLPICFLVLLTLVPNLS